MKWRTWRGFGRWFILTLLATIYLWAASARGRLTFAGQPVPGATVTATLGSNTLTTVTDENGLYTLSNLADGNWTFSVSIFGFAPVTQEVSISADSVPTNWELRLLPVDQIRAAVQIPEAAPSIPQLKDRPKEPASPALDAPQPDIDQSAADGFLINGSMNNRAFEPFAPPSAFGNNRGSSRRLYTGGIGLTFDNPALDAKPFSLTGQDTPKADYNRFSGLLTLGGPLQIPHLLKNGPFFFVGYQWTRNKDARTETALVPDIAQRNGNFSNSLIDPTTGVPFRGNTIPQNRLSAQAQALLSLYPLPNVSNGSSYNYQIPIVEPTHQDSLQSHFNKAIDNQDQLFGRFAFQSTRVDNPNLFGFLDKTDSLGINTAINWSHRFNNRWFVNFGYDFSRFASRTTPFFENRRNVSGDAGISGNNQDPINWGPPNLTFASGIASLSDSQSAFDRNQTSGLSYSLSWNHSNHNVTLGGDFHREQFNYLSQENPRGSFTFTGGATGSDFADFLLGIPDTSSIAFGNADKYFRESVFDAYVNDDWRVRPGLTLNAGFRWEYSAPITELYGRLVNLDIAPGFSAVAPVISKDPIGSITGQSYPSSLTRPDKAGFEPRIGLAWRPLTGSSMVVRAGYGVYFDSSVYQTIAQQMAQQPPLSKTLTVQNNSAGPLTLANGFVPSSTQPSNTFAIDPNFRVGYAQNWQLSIQRDLPAALQLTATYLGIKGTRGPQAFLPNTLPTGAMNACLECPRGFTYLSSNGNSTRESAAIQLRRRLRSGLAAILEYTFSKSIDDDAALGGQGGSSSQSSGPQNTFGSGNIDPAGTNGSSAKGGGSSYAIAQDWLNLSGERSLSAFHQAHQLALQFQYTSGMGLGGGTLLQGWRGALGKDWTVATQLTAGSGLPETPIYLAPVSGTGVTGSIRPDYTGAPQTASSSSRHVNPAAYQAPAAGQWGNAGRNSITGPSQLSLNASLGRTFRVGDRLNLDLRVDSTNPLNHPVFTAWNTTVNSLQFGLPVATSAMRSMQTTLRLRF